MMCVRPKADPAEAPTTDRQNSAEINKAVTFATAAEQQGLQISLVQKWSGGNHDSGERS